MKILRWSLEVGIAAVLIYLNAWALFVVFGYLVVVQLALHRRMDYQRASARIWQTGNDIRLTALTEKLGISEGDLDRVRIAIRAKVGEEAWASLERDNWTAHNG